MCGTRCAYELDVRKGTTGTYLTHGGTVGTHMANVAHIDTQRIRDPEQPSRRRDTGLPPRGQGGRGVGGVSECGGVGGGATGRGEQAQQAIPALAQCHTTIATDEVTCSWCDATGTRAKGFRRGMCPACQGKARGILPPERLSPERRMTALEDLARRVVVLDATARGVVLDALSVPREYRGCARRLVMDALRQVAPV